MFESRCRIFLLAMCLLPGLAWGHAALTKSVPGNREQLTQSPLLIRLQFNEKVEAKFSTVTLEDAQARKQALGSPTPTAENAYELQADVMQPLTAGRYTVRYRVLSQDGHVIERSYSFQIKPAATEP